MPDLPMKPYRHPGCPALTREQYCSAHAAQAAAQYDRDRAGDDRQFYSRAQWRKVRRLKLRATPLCEHCPADRPTAAREVDHKIDRRVRPDLAFAWDNLQSLCKSCHSRKTAREHLARRNRVATQQHATSGGGGPVPALGRP